MRGPHPGERLFAPDGPQPTKGRKPAAGGVIPIRPSVFARVHPAGMPRRRRTGPREGRPRGSKRATRNASRLAGGGANVTFQPRSVPERRRSARRNIDRGRGCATLGRPRSPSAEPPCAASCSSSSPSPPRRSPDARPGTTATASCGRIRSSGSWAARRRRRSSTGRAAKSRRLGRSSRPTTSRPGSRIRSTTRAGGRRTILRISASKGGLAGRGWPQARRHAPLSVFTALVA